MKEINFAAILLLLVSTLAIVPEPVNAVPDLAVSDTAFCCMPALTLEEGPIPYRSPAYVGSGVLFGIYFNVTNKGNVTAEAFNFVATDNGKVKISNSSGPVLPGKRMRVMEGTNILFDTLGYHKIQVYVKPVNGEIIIGNNIKNISVYVYDQKLSNLNLTGCDDYQAGDYVGVNCTLKNEGKIKRYDVRFVVVNRSNKIVGIKNIPSIAPGQVLTVALVTTQTYPVETIVAGVNINSCDGEELTCNDNYRYIMNVPI